MFYHKYSMELKEAVSAMVFYSTRGRMIGLTIHLKDTPFAIVAD